MRPKIKVSVLVSTSKSWSRPSLIMVFAVKGLTFARSDKRWGCERFLAFLRNSWLGLNCVLWGLEGTCGPEIYTPRLVRRKGPYCTHAGVNDDRGKYLASGQPGKWGDWDDWDGNTRETGSTWRGNSKVQPVGIFPPSSEQVVIPPISYDSVPAE